MDLDLDDDFYIYQVDVPRSVEIYQLYEVYKIHKRGQPVLNKIGNSSSIDCCCNFVNDGKTVRRHDLRVCFEGLNFSSTSLIKVFSSCISRELNLI